MSCGVRRSLFFSSKISLPPEIKIESTSEIFAGSAATLFECVRNAVRFGISPEEALYAASLLPARVVGQESTVGSIAPGKSADFLICDRDWHLLAVYKNGREISC